MEHPVRLIVGQQTTLPQELALDTIVIPLMAVIREMVIVQAATIRIIIMKLEHQPCRKHLTSTTA